MSAAKVFVDTNILVHAYERGDEDKKVLARRKVRALWDAPQLPSVSVQVLQELYVTLLKRKLTQRQALAIVQNHLRWEVVENTTTLLVRGIRLHQRHMLSFWDALVLAAAKEAKAVELWSEDFAVGQVYDGLTIVNPLLS